MGTHYCAPGPDPVTQLTLDLPRRTTFDRSDFLVSDCNVAAVDWIDRWPVWPCAALVVYGPPGCGKTHISHLWRERASAVILAGEELTETALPGLFGNAGPLRIAVDNADRAPEHALLHLYNFCLERAGNLLITMRSAPGSWKVQLDDLRSRLRSAIVVGIEAPDDAVLGAVLFKHFADRQLRVSPVVIAYVTKRIERSFTAAEALAARLDSAALSGGKRVTIALARRVFRELGGQISSPGSDAAVTHSTSA
jgi:chromosomal replication initiation ATPase DnaA